MPEPAPPDAAAPQLVLTVGVHGSASTWVFNVVRALFLAAYGTGAVTACYVARSEDLVAARSGGARHIVGKAHSWPELDARARQPGVTAIVSIRDPRDAVFSLMQRFDETINVAAAGVARDLHCARSFRAAGHPVLRYEDRFFDDPATVRRLAGHLGIAVPDAELDRIFRTYRTDAVRALAAAVATLPPERRGGDGGRLVLDRETLITHRHIGDARSGKWRELADAETRRRLTQFFAPFLFSFGYDLN